MDIGIPKERRDLEMRVGLTPYGVKLLTESGHACYVECGAGEGAGFSDRDYERAQGRIVYSTEEAYLRSDMVLKVSAREPISSFERITTLLSKFPSPSLAAAFLRRMMGCVTIFVITCANPRIKMEMITDTSRISFLNPVTGIMASS